MPRLRRVAKTLPRWADLVLTSAMREGPVPPPYLGWVVPAAPPQQVDQVQMSRMRDRLVPPPPQQRVAPAAPFRQVGPKAPMVLPRQLTAAGHIHRGHTHCHCGPLQIGSGQHHQYGMHHGCCLPCHCHFYTSYSGCPESTDHSVHREKRSMNRTHRWQRRCSRIDRCSDVSGRSALPCTGSPNADACGWEPSPTNHLPPKCKVGESQSEGSQCRVKSAKAPLHVENTASPF